MGLGAEVMEPGTAETRKQEGRRERGPRVGRAFWPRREPVTPEAIEACNRASTAMPFRRELAISRNALMRARQRLKESSSGDGGRAASAVADTAGACA